MSKKSPTVPAITSTFALLDVMKGRAALEKIVSDGNRIRVTIEGFVQNGRGGVGRDDGTSREFSIDVESVRLGVPEFVPSDHIGRAWATVKDLKAGDKVTLDGGFTCLTAADQMKPQKIKADRKSKQLYFSCCGEGRTCTGAKREKHFLGGQIGDHGEYIGVYKVG